MSKELSKEEMQTELNKMATMIANLKQNQQGLVQDNESLHRQLKNATDGKMIYGKLLAIKKDLGAIGKNHNFEMGGKTQYSFRGIDDVVNNLFPLLNKHGVGVRTNCLQNAEDYKLNEKTGKYSKNVRIMMEYIFFAEDGSEVSCKMPGEGTDTSDKGTNKALSAAFKYCLFQCFCIPTEVGVVEEGDFEKVPVGSSESVEAKKVPTKKAPPRKAPAKKAETKGSSFRKNKALKAVSGGENELEEL